MGFLSGVLGTSNSFNPQDAGNVKAQQSLAPKNTYRATSPAAAPTVAQANTQASGGAGPASGTIARQSALSDSLAAAAAGQGPNAALEQLRQTTQQNVNTAAGQAASARGVNPALAARMAVDSAATSNQTAAGQAATLEAEQQVQARQQLAQNLQATGATQIGQQTAGTGALQVAGGLDLGAQGIDAGVANQNAGLELGQEQLAAGVGAGNAATNAGLVGGLLQGAGSAASAAMLMSDGGDVPELLAAPEPGASPVHDYLSSLYGAAPPTPAPALAKPSGSTGTGAASAGSAIADGGKAGADAFRGIMGQRLAGTGSIYADGGRVPALVSPGEIVTPPGTGPRQAARIAESGAGKVPGKARVAGDSPKNDIVPAKLRPGSIVLPRSVANASDPGKAAASFVASVMKRSDKRYAVGGKVSPSPRARAEQDLSEGGLVSHASGPDDKAEPRAKVRKPRRKEAR